MAEFDPMKQLSQLLPLLTMKQQQEAQARDASRQEEEDRLNKISKILQISEKFGANAGEHAARVLGFNDQDVLGLSREIGAESKKQRDRALNEKTEEAEGLAYGGIINRAQARPGKRQAPAPAGLTREQRLALPPDPNLPGLQQVGALTEAAKRLAQRAPDVRQNIINRGLAESADIDQRRVELKELTDAEVRKALREATGKAKIALQSARDTQNIPSLSDESSARGQFLQQSSDFVKIRDAYFRIDSVSKTESGFSDLALIFNFMKMLDPGSTVREGEFATAANAGGVDDRTRALYNSLRFGGFLSENQRRDLIGRSGDLMKAALVGQDRLAKGFSSMSSRNGLTVENVALDLTKDVKSILAGKKPGPGPLPPEGEPQDSVYLRQKNGLFVFQRPDGSVFGTK